VRRPCLSWRCSPKNNSSLSEGWGYFVGAVYLEMSSSGADAQTPSRYVKCTALEQPEGSQAVLAVENMASERQCAPIAGARWYAVNCLSNRELLAAAQLRNQGFEVFLPCRLITRRHARKFDTVLRPFFPGYLFVRLDLDRHRWRSVNGTLGVVRLVGQSEAPSPAPSGAIEAIRHACDDLGVMRASEDLAPGDAVFVAFGPFAELIGKLERLDSAGRIRVLLELMGRRACVALPRDYVVSARQAA